MNQKLLSIKEKRELLQRMARAVKKGAALDAFCENEGINRETLFIHLHEMRALGTKGINSFLPDKEAKKLTLDDKKSAVERILKYAKTSKLTQELVCSLAGITISILTKWKNLLKIHEAECAGKFPPLLDVKKISASQKRRILKAIEKMRRAGATVDFAARMQGISEKQYYKWGPPSLSPTNEEKRDKVNAVIQAVNNGMTLKEALKRAKMAGPTFKEWEKNYATVKNIKGKRYKGAAEKTRIVDEIIQAVNNGKRQKDILKRIGMTRETLKRWEKCYATLKRTKIKQYFNAAEKARIVEDIIQAVNNGMTLTGALKQAGIGEASFYKWEKHYAKTSRAKRFRDVAEKSRIVDEIVQAVDKGVKRKEAIKRTGISNAAFFRWEKRYATLKRANIARKYSAADKARIVDEIIHAVNNGMTSKEAARRAGIPESTFLIWEKNYAMAKRANIARKYSAVEKSYIVAEVIQAVNSGISLKEAARRAGITENTFTRWEQLYAKAKRANVRRKLNATEKTRIVDEVVRAVNNGMTLKEAIKQAGADTTNFWIWEKRYATVKRFKRQTDAADKARIVDEINQSVNNGMMLKDALERAGIPSTTFFKWEKRYATVKRVKPRKDTAEKTRIVADITQAANNGLS